MDQCENREEGVPPSKTTLCGEHESQTKAQRNPPGPELWWESKEDLDNFKVQPMSAAERIHGRPAGPEPGRNCMSVMSPRIPYVFRRNAVSELRSAEQNSLWYSSPLCIKSVSEIDSGYGSTGSVQCKDSSVSRPPDMVEPAGVRWLTPGLRKYSCQLTIDTNTVNTNLQLSDNNRKVTRVEEVQSYPDHPDRFDVREQLLCRDGLTGRCYWEVEWRGHVYISVSYKRISRKGNSYDCLFGYNKQSWSMYCNDDGPCSVWHNNRDTPISSSSSSVSNRAAVYVDCPAGTLSFYRVSSDTLIHLHTFNTTFTEPLYPGFRVRFPQSSVSLC